MRPIVEEFANVMEDVLKENDHKGGWDNLSHHEMLERLFEEANELDGALYNKGVPENVRKEAADVANFAMFIYDKFGRVNKESEFV